MLKQIVNGRILTPQGWINGGSVIYDDNRILEVRNNSYLVAEAREVIDAKGMTVAPGGVEIHIHGGGGRDFMEGTEDAFREAINAHMQHGTTSIFPTLSSSTIPMIEAAAETCTKLMQEPNSPVLGLHLEGHYLNIRNAGGQFPENIKDPDPKEYVHIVENDFINIYNGERGQKSSKTQTTTLSKEITKNLLMRDRLEALINRKKSVQRKDLVFMKFYLLSLDMAEKEEFTTNDYWTFIDECNDMLMRCGFSRLYPGNRFENLILLSLLSSRPYEMFENILEYSFFNEPEFNNEN